MKPEAVPLLRKAVQWAEIEAQKPQAESHWYQRTVHMSEAERRQYQDAPKGCGSAYCIAGYIVSQQYGVENPYHATRGTGQAVMPTARDLLGITHGEAEELFAALNTIEEIRAIAQRIAGEEL